MEYQFSINKRLFSELFARYSNTFIALCELINNALQARAKEIRITIVPARVDKLTESPFESITIRDNGVGVSKSDFRWKILEIATDAKQGGKGIGRFAALQVGATMAIETVAYDQPEDCFFKTSVAIRSAGWGDLKTLDRIRLDVNHVKLSGTPTPYYQVEITDFYTESATKTDAHKRIHRDLQPDHIETALFARYADIIFRQTTKFIVNDKWINPETFVIGDVEKTEAEFVALDGLKHLINYQFMLIKSTEGDHRVFLRVMNCGIQTVAQIFDYAADIPETNRWFVFVDSPYLDQNTDLFRSFDLGGLEGNAQQRLIKSIKEHIDAFFAQRYEFYKDFVERLKSDASYPYREKPPSSQSRNVVFNQIAFHVEQEHHLLGRKNQIRRLVYALIDRALNQGDFETLLSQVATLDEATIARFRELLSRVDVEDVIAFCDQVARKSQYLDFLHTIVYGEPAQHLKERSQLHRIIERHLWLFGENYNGTPVLFSDKNLKNNLLALRNQFFAYEPTEADGNLIDLDDVDLRSITDLFFFNEKILDDTRREVMVVELKAPKVRIHQKELNQAEGYAYQIQEQGVFPDNLSYKILLVSSELSGFVKTKQGQIDPRNPFVVYRSSPKPVEVWALKWSDLIELNRRKLSYLGNALETKDRDIKEVFEKEFGDVPLQKLKSIIEETKPRL